MKQLKRLSMVEVNIVGLASERPNIKYCVVSMPTMAELCSSLALELSTNTPQTVAFCQMYHNVPNLISNEEKVGKEMN